MKKMEREALETNMLAYRAFSFDVTSHMTISVSHLGVQQAINKNGSLRSCRLF